MIPTQSRHPPLFISTFTPPPYSSASHCKYRVSKPLRGPSSNEVTSFGDKDTVPEDDAKLAEGKNDANRDNWKCVWAWKVCNRARVVNTCRSRRWLGPTSSSRGIGDGGETCWVFTLTPVDFPLAQDNPLERRCGLGADKLELASGLPIPVFRTYEPPTDKSSSPSSLTPPQLALFPVELPHHGPIHSPAHMMQTSSYTRHPSVHDEGTLVNSFTLSQ